MDVKIKKIADEIKNNKKIKTLLYAILAVVAVLLLVITAAQKLGNVTINTMTAGVKAYFMSMGSGDGFPYDIDSQSVKDMKLNNSNFLVLFDDSTMLLTSTAKEIMPKEHKYSNPVMKTNGNHVIVYDLDSGKYRIQNSSEVVSEAELPNRILAGAIGKKGNYAVATYSDEVQSEVTVYTSSNKKAFSRSFKSETVSAVSLSDNGKYVAVSTVFSKDGKMSSKVYVLNLSSGKDENCFEYDSTVVLRVDYIKGENLSVLGDNLRSYIKNGKKKTDDITFGSDTLHNYSLSQCGNSVLVLSRYGSESLSGLYLYNERNKEKFCVDLDKEIKWVDCDDKYTAVLLENEVRTYDKNGKQIGSISFTGQPLRVAVDGKKTYVLTSASLQCYDTKGSQKAE